MKLSKIFVPVLMCALLTTAGAQAKTYLNTGKLNEINDFEDYNTGIVSKGGSEIKTIRNEFGAATDAWSIETTKGNMTAAIDETVGKDGKTTKALHFYVDGASSVSDQHTLMQARPDTDRTGTAINWNPDTKGKYFVYELDFKSGGEGCGYFGASPLNIDGYATVNWETGKAGFGASASEQAFALDEWVTMRFIADKTKNTDTADLYLCFESSIGTKWFKKEGVSGFVAANSNPRWLGGGWIKGGSSKAENPSLYFDNIAYYITDYNVICQNDGLVGVKADDKIMLDISGDVDENSLKNITVSAAGEPVEIDNISFDNGVCTVKLNKKMEEFTEYTVDFSSVSSSLGLCKNFAAAKFTTTGKITLDADVTAEKVGLNSVTPVSAIEKGLIQVTFNVKNNTAVKAESVTLVASLVKNGSPAAMSYKTLSLAQGSTSKLVCAFSVPDDGYSIELIAKDSINGTMYCSDMYRIDKNGISNTAMPDDDLEYPVINAAEAENDTVKYYSLSLGENAQRKNITAIDSGMIECAAGVSSADDAMLISTLKKDGAMNLTVYQLREKAGDIMYNIINVPDDTGYSVDSFAWSDILGTNGYMSKAVISHNAEGK